MLGQLISWNASSKSNLSHTTVSGSRRRTHGRSKSSGLFLFQFCHRQSILIRNNIILFNSNYCMVRNQGKEASSKDLQLSHRIWRWQFIYFDQIPTFSETKGSISVGQHHHDNNCYPINPCMPIRKLSPSHRERLQNVANTERFAYRPSKLPIIDKSNMP
jgi:hypothetical protein